MIHRGTSLSPTKSTNWYCGLIDKWKMFNRHQRLDNHPQMSFDMWCVNANIDLSGKTLVKIT